ncbi:MAG TPA: hypothetical protein PLA88_10915 [Bacteroidales bacterium]|nr:hypothetical protein [Bacteroidales bacterium]
MKNHVFTVDGVSYEIKIALKDQSKILVRAFKSNSDEPANGFCYSIGLTMNIDMTHVQGVTGLQTLIGIAKDDVINRRWDELEKTLKNTRRNLKTDSLIQWQ